MAEGRAPLKRFCIGMLGEAGGGMDTRDRPVFDK
jgi:hypothetical protein